MNKYGFRRITTASPVVSIGNVAKNTDTHFKIIQKFQGKTDFLVFPELSLTGYSCEDLFRQQKLFMDVDKGLNVILNASLGTGIVVIVGAPCFVPETGALYNCAFIIYEGQILGIVPKTYLPNYREFYESRWFAGATGQEPKIICDIPFGKDLLFKYNKTIFGVEICEDVFAPIPPSSYQALGGATLLFNLSASNEIVGKADFRRDFVKGQSGKLLAGYVYCSAGPSESTKDIVFGGHCLIGENGAILAESDRFIPDTHTLTVDIDIQRLQNERMSMPQTFAQCANHNKKDFRYIDMPDLLNHCPGLMRNVDAHPFVPKHNVDSRCEDIFNIQITGLAQRLKALSKDIYIGVSGGLDSTLALLVACKAYDSMGWDRKHIHGITMPGFGTTNKTEDNANKLMNALGVTSKTIEIHAMCLEQFKAMNHQPFGLSLTNEEGDEWLELGEFETSLKKLTGQERDLVFENVQARIRTQLLMSHGFVLGTGDLSEIALGWSTYNGDHMSMYNVNASIPKTLVKTLVDYVKRQMVDTNLQQILEDILNTPVSPELLPFEQITENNIGPYELHDFFLYNFMRCGFDPSKILFLAQQAKFDQKYELNELKAWLEVFYTRFFNNQFKRDCVPGGPKVGSVSLSPRGDWRMATEAQKDSWIQQVQEY